MGGYVATPAPRHADGWKDRVYFKVQGGRSMGVLMLLKKIRPMVGTASSTRLLDASDTPIVRHIKIIGRCQPTRPPLGMNTSSSRWRQSRDAHFPREGRAKLTGILGFLQQGRSVLVRLAFKPSDPKTHRGIVAIFVLEALGHGPLCRNGRRTRAG